MNRQTQRRIVRAVRSVEKTDLDAVRRFSQGMDVSRPPVSYGMPTATFTGGTTITLNPTDSAGNDLPGLDNVICHLAPDKRSVTVSFSTSDIIRFARYPTLDASSAGGVLLGFIADSSAMPTIAWEGWIDTGESPPGSAPAGIQVLDANDWRGRVIRGTYDVYVGTDPAGATPAQAAGDLAWDFTNTLPSAGGELSADGVFGSGLTTAKNLLQYDCPDANTHVAIYVDGANAGKLTAKVWRDTNATFVRTQLRGVFHGYTWRNTANITLVP